MISFFVRSESNVLYCGIFGGIGYVRADLIKMLMIQNESRGGHATGFWNPSQGVVKRAKKSHDFLEEVGDNMEDSTIYLGHTRYGTHGTNTDTNAHPFQKGIITLIHNGVLSNHNELSKTYGFDWNVDSEALPELILRQGYKGIEEVKGSIACVWVNGDNTLHLYKRDNPVFTGEIRYEDGSKGTYFSSLENSLKSIGCKFIKSLDSDTYYQINQGGEIVKQEKLKVPVQSHNTYNKTWEDFRKDTKTPVGKYNFPTYNHWEDEEDNFKKWEIKDGEWIQKGLDTISTPKLLGEKTPDPKIVEETEDVIFIEKDTIENLAILLLEVHSKLIEIQEYDLQTPAIITQVELMLKEISGIEMATA